MVPAVAIDRLAGTDQRGDCACVGGKAGREEQCRFDALELGQSLGQTLVCCGIAGHQGTGPAAPTLAGDGLGRGPGQSRIGGQTEVIVRAEVDQFTTVDFYADGLRAGAQSQSAAEFLLIERGQFVVDPGEGVHGRIIAESIPLRNRKRLQHHF